MDQILNILSSVGFNWHVALANFFNFLIILFLLNKFFFRKISNTIDSRHKVIEHGLNQAREAEISLRNAEEEKNAILKKAHGDADVVAANAQHVAKQTVLTLVKEAEESIALRHKKLDEEEKKLTDSVEKAFASKAPHLVAELYAKTLMKELTEEENNKLVLRMRS